jgi:hypothetical protein
MDFTEIECEGVDWIHVAQKIDQWQALVSFVTNLVSMLHVDFIIERLFTTQEGLCSAEFRVLQL